MCVIDWEMLLEYLKVILSWPPVALLIAILFISRFRKSIDDFLGRLVEGNFLGQQVKAVPPTQQASSTVTEDRIKIAAEENAQENTTQSQQSADSLPPELADDPQALEAVNYVKTHPADTIVEYRRLLYSYNSERLFARIYGTQIALLEFLMLRAGTPTTLAQLAPFHNDYQQKIGNYDYQLREYVNFLVSYQAVSVSGPENANEYSITQHGVEFLSYIKNNYPLAWNNRLY